MHKRHAPELLQSNRPAFVDSHARHCTTDVVAEGANQSDQFDSRRNAEVCSCDPSFLTLCASAPVQDVNRPGEERTLGLVVRVADTKEQIFMALVI